MWLSLVERLVRDEEAAGSNPVIPTRIGQRVDTIVLTLFFFAKPLISKGLAVFCFPGVEEK